MKDCWSFFKLWFFLFFLFCVLLNLVKNCLFREILLYFNINCVVFYIINCMFKKKFKLLDVCDFNVIIFCKDYLFFILSICIILY